jgi:C4-dicarboxylate transporter/malic acid transport protein
MSPYPFSSHPTFIEYIKHFTPNWFSVNMGTGITALCLANFPGHPSLLHSLGFALWAGDIVLFILFLFLWISSIGLCPKLHHRILQHSVSPLFLGCPPMALATIVNGFLVFGIPVFGEIAAIIAQFLWWIDVLFALAVVIVVPYYMFSSHSHQLENMTAIWLLPFVACEVAAASGGLLLPHIPSQEGLIILVVSYFLWGISLPLAFSVLVIYFQRLAIHKLPSAEVAATVWLPLGPIGTGALALLTLGEGATNILMRTGSNLDPLWTSFLSVLSSVGLMIALMILGFATWWASIALFMTIRYLREGLSFNLSFWSFTFPLGVYTAAILNLAALTHWGILARYGAVLTIALSLIWGFVFYRTLPGLYSGKLVKNNLL